MPASVTATVSGMSPASTSTRCSSPSSVRARVGDVRAIDPRMAAPQTLFAAARDADGGDHRRVQRSGFRVQGSGSRSSFSFFVLTYPTYLAYPAHLTYPAHSGAT